MVKRGLLLCLLVLLQGCSAVKLGYNQMPALSYWWLDGQLSFKGEQSDQVKEALQQLQQWHREQELPRYAELLQKLQEMSTRDVDAQQVCALWTQVDDGLNRLMAQSMRLAAPIALQLQRRQLHHLVRHWEEKNEDWEKDWLSGSPQQRLDKRLDRAVSRYSDFYGRLNDAQTELLRTQLQKSVWTAEWGRQERLRRQQTLLSALQGLQQGKYSTTEAQAILQGVWKQWLAPASGTDRQLYTQFVNQSCQHLAELHNSTTAEQRQRAARRLRAYEKDLRELVGRS